MPVKPRRSHRKSRNGCRVCKSRHMKCDETRPACINCSVAGRDCEYRPSPTSRLKSPRSDSILATPSPSSCTSNPSPAATSASSPSYQQRPEVYKGSQTPVPDGAGLFTLEHLSLFHYAQNFLDDTMMAQASSPQTISAIIEHALHAPYLMNELLAIAALHLSHCHPDRSDYKEQATTLQTRALRSFNEVKQDVSEATCVPMFIFSSLLGLHVLHDTLRCRPDNFSIFLDQFMSYLCLHRGVTAMTGKSWTVIKNSGLNSAITQIEDAFDNASDLSNEVQALYKMLDESQLNPSSIETYHQAIRTLQNNLNLHRALKEKGVQPAEGPIAFCITVNEEYVDYLKQRRPEALVILAFYATMLYWSRDFWIYGDGGQYLIKAITAHLGSHWERWLIWPNSVLRSESHI